MKWKCVSEGSHFTKGKIYTEINKPSYFGDGSYLIDNSGTKRRSAEYYNSAKHLPIECKFINVTFNTYLDEVESL